MKGEKMSCLINEEILERLYEDFLEILAKDNKLPLEQREKEAALLAQEEFEKQQQKGEKMSEAKKDWEVTLSSMKKHDDTYLIRNVNKDQAKWIAENQNASPNFDCTLIKEDVSDGEDEETIIKEVK